MNRIAALREERGWSQSDLAEKLGMHWQSVSRLENGHTKLTTERAAEIAEIFGVPMTEVLFAPMSIRAVPVTGAVEAGAWREAVEWPPDRVYNVPVPNKRGWLSLSLFGAEVRGNSMNRRYPEGSVVVSVLHAETGGHLQEGKPYIVDRIRHGERERTVKILTRSRGALWLAPDSDDASYAAFPLRAKDAEIHIVGRVVWAHRNEEDEAAVDGNAET